MLNECSPKLNECSTSAQRSAQRGVQRSVQRVFNECSTSVQRVFNRMRGCVCDPRKHFSMTRVAWARGVCEVSHACRASNCAVSVSTAVRECARCVMSATMRHEKTQNKTCKTWTKMKEEGSGVMGWGGGSGWPLPFAAAQEKTLFQNLGFSIQKKIPFRFKRLRFKILSVLFVCLSCVVDSEVFSGDLIHACCAWREVKHRKHESDTKSEYEIECLTPLLARLVMTWRVLQQLWSFKTSLVLTQHKQPFSCSSRHKGEIAGCTCQFAPRPPSQPRITENYMSNSHLLWWRIYGTEQSTTKSPMWPNIGANMNKRAARSFFLREDTSALFFGVTDKNWRKNNIHAMTTVEKILKTMSISSSQGWWKQMGCVLKRIASFFTFWCTLFSVHTCVIHLTETPHLIHGHKRTSYLPRKPALMRVSVWSLCMLSNWKWEWNRFSLLVTWEFVLYSYWKWRFSFGPVSPSQLWPENVKRFRSSRPKIRRLCFEHQKKLWKRTCSQNIGPKKNQILTMENRLEKAPWLPIESPWWLPPSDNRLSEPTLDPLPTYTHETSIHNSPEILRKSQKMSTWRAQTHPLLSRHVFNFLWQTPKTLLPNSPSSQAHSATAVPSPSHRVVNICCRLRQPSSALRTWCCQPCRPGARSAVQINQFFGFSHETLHHNGAQSPN